MHFLLYTMDIDCALARIMGRRRPWLMEMHLYYFSRRTLSAMLEKAGLTVLRAEPQGRYLSLGYPATRVGGLLGDSMGRGLGGLIELLGLGRLPVSINTGDLFTAYAVKQ